MEGADLLGYGICRLADTYQRFGEGSCLHF